MEQKQSRVTVHMVASLDGFIARRDGSVDWMETASKFEQGKSLNPEFVEQFLAAIDCYVIGSRTYETALRYEAQGLGWVYGDKPTFVLTSRELPVTRSSVTLSSGDLAALINEQIKPRFGNIWVGGGSFVSGEFLRLGLADEICYSIVPVLIGEGIPFFGGLVAQTALELRSVDAYKNGMVELHYEVRR